MISFLTVELSELTTVNGVIASVLGSVSYFASFQQD